MERLRALDIHHLEEQLNIHQSNQNTFIEAIGLLLLFGIMGLLCAASGVALVGFAIEEYVATGAIIVAIFVIVIAIGKIEFVPDYQKKSTDNVCHPQADYEG